MTTRRWLAAGVGFALLWVAINGPELAAGPVLASFLVGLGVGLPVAFVFRRLYEPETAIVRTLGTIPYVVRFILVFAKEVLVANVDVAYRVLAPDMPLEPQVILVPLRVETDLAITTVANAISLTPGTVTLDYDPDRNALYVHVINGDDIEGMIEPIRHWENDALVIFDERRSPTDPPPAISIHPPEGPPDPKQSPPERGTAPSAGGGQSVGDGATAPEDGADMAESSTEADAAPSTDSSDVTDATDTTEEQ